NGLCHKQCPCRCEEGDATQSGKPLRKLWQHVTESLREGDIDKATEHKKALEERQRNEERHRAETDTPWNTKHFHKEGDGWVYYNPLWKRMPAVQNQPVDAN
ncbi:UNVERIFIED_CONTAM: Oxysterol-binding protein- protein 11, partial [Gekko kuhli]